MKEISELSNEKKKLLQFVEKQTHIKENKEEEIERILDECVALKAGKAKNKHEF